MNTTHPPALAAWILKHVARDNEALIGDLLEEYRRRQSPGWYWQQVVMTIVVAESRAALLCVGVAALYLVGSAFYVPGSSATVRALMERAAGGNTPWRLFSVMQGGQLTGVTIFALGINPYISAAFIVQALALAWRFWRRNTERSQRGRLVLVTWCLALVLCATQAFGLATFLELIAKIDGGTIVAHPGLTFRLTTLLTLTAGTVCLMLISDQISKRRLGNGMFIVFMAGLLAAVPGIFVPLVSGEIDPLALLTMMGLNTAIAAVVSHGYRRAIEQETLQLS